MTRLQDDKRRHPTFSEVKRAAQQAITRVLEHWLPGGLRVDGGKEYTAPNPTRADNHVGSLKVNLAKGTWCDFATGDKGGDLIDLVRYLDGGTDVEACNKLVDFLGVTASTTTLHPLTSSKARASDWMPMLPIPDDAMRKVPLKHRQHGMPTKVWIYRDSDARPLFVLYRFDLGLDESGVPRKVFAPLTWCKNSSAGAMQWRWQGLAGPRPLLHLDQLTARAADPVVICEGEKAADAAAELLPGYVATCWPNGTNSWRKADFAPLTGRVVLLWPDNDAAGLTCMDALTEHLRLIGAASVQVLALAVLSQRPDINGNAVTFSPDGEWAEGDDAADAVAKGWTPAHLAALERSGELFAIGPSSQSTPEKMRPATSQKSQNSAGSGSSKEKLPAQLGGFRVMDTGVVYCGEDGEPRPVCSPLWIIARTRDDKGHNWGLLVEFDDPDGDRKRLNISASSMAGDFGKEVLAPLVNMGLRLAGSRAGRNTRNDLQSYLHSYESKDRARLVHRLGWHGGAYLMPDKQIGASQELLHFYEAGAQLPPISQAGTLEEWQRQIGALCLGNHRLVFVVCVALAGPLLHLVGQESGGFHLYGDSSGGKTTHLQVAASVYGGPRLVRSWRSTDNALESIAAAHSDGLLVLDEIGMCDPRIIGETIYMLGNGTGKARANDRGQAGRQVQEWRLLFLSTGEKTLAQHMAEANKELKAGMEVRLLALPADANKGLGMFEVLHNFEDAAALSDALKARVGKNYGSPLIAFLSALCEPGKLEAYQVMLRRTLERYTAETLPNNSSGQAQRAAARFGLAAAVGELATALGITGWPDGTASLAARVCQEAWMAERGSAGNMENDAIVARLRLMVERYGESRFTRWDSVAAKVDDHAPRTTDRLGFRRTIEHSYGDAQYTTTTFYLLPTAWRDEVFKGMNLRNVNRVLAEREILQSAKDGKAAQALALPGMPKTRAYVVDAAKLFADEREASAIAA